MMQEPPPLRRAGNLSDPKSPQPSSLGSFKRKLQTLKDRSKLISASKQHDALLPQLQNVLDSSSSTSPAVGDIRVPLLLQQGTPMTKVSLKKHKKFVFRLDADLGQIVWESKQLKISKQL